MAKHAKKTKRKSSGRRRRVGAMPKLNIQSVALQIGGAVVASKLQQMLAKDPTKTTMVAVSPYVGLAGGIILPMITKNAAVKDLSNGMLIMGGVSVLKKLAPGLIGNIPSVPIISGSMNRYRSIPKPSVNGIGSTNLPNSSIFRDSMSVISGIGNAGSGDGSATAMSY